jgi:excisionase family DNA binding protein
VSAQIEIDVLWDPDDPFLRPRQAALLLGVEPRTVSNWARLGMLEAQRTSGGHHRFRLSDVQRLARDLPSKRMSNAPWWA